MTGDNELHLNSATIVAAVQMYLNSAFTLDHAVVVESVSEQASGNTYGAAKNFIVKVKAKTEVAKED